MNDLPFFSEDNSADAVVARMADCDDARLKQVMTSVIRHLHEFKELPDMQKYFDGILDGQRTIIVRLPGCQCILDEVAGNPVGHPNRHGGIGLGGLRG